MALQVGTPRQTGLLDDYGLKMREEALRRKMREQQLISAEAAMQAGEGVTMVGANPMTPLANVGGTQFQAPTKTVGGSGVPTVGGVTQGGGIYAGKGELPNPMGFLDRIGNYKGKLALPSPMATMADGSEMPEMGSLDSFYAWQKSGMPPIAPQSNAAASGALGGGVRANPLTGLVGSGPNPFETGEQAYNRLFGKPLSIIPGRASGGPVSRGEPVVVGEKGPEVLVPNEDGDVIPNSALYSTDDAARRRRAALRKGDFHAYLNTMLEANVHIPAHA